MTEKYWKYANWSYRNKKLLGHIKLLDNFTNEMDQVDDRLSDIEDKIDESEHSDNNKYVIR